MAVFSDLVTSAADGGSFFLAFPNSSRGKNFGQRAGRSSSRGKNFCQRAVRNCALAGNFCPRTDPPHPGGDCPRLSLPMKWPSRHHPQPARARRRASAICSAPLGFAKLFRSAMSSAVSTHPRPFAKARIDRQAGRSRSRKSGMTAKPAISRHRKPGLTAKRAVRVLPTGRLSARLASGVRAVSD